MTANQSRLWTAIYEEESSWGEAGGTLAASGTRFEVLGEPQVSFDQERIAPDIAKQYSEEQHIGVLGPQGGSFTIDLVLSGHGGTTAGSLTQTDLHALLQNFLGGGDVGEDGDVVQTASNAYTLTGAVEGWTTHDLIRVGALGDGRAEGQWAVVDNGGAVTLKTALPGTPANPDVIYSALNLYPNEVSSQADVTSTRWLIMTSNGQWVARGCFPQSITFSGLNVGEQPRVSLTYGVSRWEDTSETFPSALAKDAKDGAIVAAGSTFVQNLNTVTRAAYSMRSWDLSIDMQVQPLMGPGGAGQYQTIIGARRTRCAATFNMVFDAEAAGTTTWADKFDAATWQHVLLSLSVTDGKALAFYFQQCKQTTRPTQSISDGLNRVSTSWRCATGEDAASTGNNGRASWKLALG